MYKGVGKKTARITKIYKITNQRRLPISKLCPSLDALLCILWIAYLSDRVLSTNIEKKREYATILYSHKETRQRRKTQWFKLYHYLVTAVIYPLLVGVEGSRIILLCLMQKFIYCSISHNIRFLVVFHYLPAQPYITSPSLAF